jgi:hypothetical protein
MDAAAIRDFVRRNREVARDLKRSHWADRFRTHGAAATLAAAEALRVYMRRVRPDWPTERDRADDLAHHRDLKSKIDRAAHAFAGR